ncbi:MAG: ABC transporter ATP-binding protein [Candidatus Bipolaricaulota bacterium]|nr:ABC transporter ATP-binding protein [Candidatus Bipolaricaulota bacterium]
MMIETQDLTKYYQRGGAPALQNVTVQIPEGNIGLLGENGAGKTTFIKICLGLLAPTSGTARVLGMANTERELRRKVGYMPEDDVLPPDLSPMDLLVRLGRVSGLPFRAAMERAHDVLYLVGLGEERFRPIEGFSVGMKQRVKLAQALVHDPKVVFLDEPTSGMDPHGRDEMLQLIKSIREKLQINILLSTHLLIDVERTCDAVVILREGQLIAQGYLKDLLAGFEDLVYVRVSGDLDGFAQRLQSAGLRVSVIGSELALEFDGERVYEILWREAANHGVQVRRVERQGHTLEQLFLRLHKAAPTK